MKKKIIIINYTFIICYYYVNIYKNIAIVTYNNNNILIYIILNSYIFLYII